VVDGADYPIEMVPIISDKFEREKVRKKIATHLYRPRLMNVGIAFAR